VREEFQHSDTNVTAINIGNLRSPNERTTLALFVVELREMTMTAARLLCRPAALIVFVTVWILVGPINAKAQQSNDLNILNKQVVQLYHTENTRKQRTSRRPSAPTIRMSAATSTASPRSTRPGSLRRGPTALGRAPGAPPDHPDFGRAAFYCK
jgi:hypothetical protein